MHQEAVTTRVENDRGLDKGRDSGIKFRAYLES